MMKADNKKQNNDHELLIKLLQDKYEGAKAESLTAIYAENPDYAGRIKAMGRKSKELFGTTLALYLKQIGVIGLRKKTEKASDAFSVFFLSPITPICFKYSARVVPNSSLDFLPIAFILPA